eukprot:CAMPEP_0116071602 /NCGR_PEP_ID=MMETSP0322-20121206/13885_1 /TAXON_ID=163516 /ORGANISM="Leptocylindrus danicus var. apora, Strain B651" /LENGTH=641 /DNA_ID=CAMNT_0003559997 /DNA_START=170 /DNA_END=2091 /DNA_ORIENTATION=+
MPSNNDDNKKMNSDEDDDIDKKRKKSSKKRKKSDSRRGRDRKHSRRRSKKSSRKERRPSRSPSYSSSESSSDHDDDNDSYSNGNDKRRKKRPSSKKVSVLNPKLAAKLAERGETLDERRSRRRGERIASQFGYTNENNPFRDDNLSATFQWKKKVEADKLSNSKGRMSQEKVKTNAIEEIEKVRARRKEREEAMVERERLRAEESRIREMQHYDVWMKKEEEFHLEQQRQRSAIRLTQGREKPIDVLAKNLLMFGLSDDERSLQNSGVKYQEKYNALDELRSLEAEITEPHVFIKDLTLKELNELLDDVNEYIALEKEVNQSSQNENVSTNEEYWNAMKVVCEEEIAFIKSGGNGGTHDLVAKDISKMFDGQTTSALSKLKVEILSKIEERSAGVDTDYWYSVLKQLGVHQARATLSEIHSIMLLRQLDKIEDRKNGMKNRKPKNDNEENSKEVSLANGNELPEGAQDNTLNVEDEVDLGQKTYKWNDKYRPRKPRYFNRVKTGYDWNKYNQTHYDHDNPPPKTVQGYKFDIFYPDLIDRSKTPQYFLERADSNDFCIIRFSAGPPYEDIAFKIINREWNRSRKRGFKSVFERGVLTLHFNFNTALVSSVDIQPMMKFFDKIFITQVDFVMFDNVICMLSQ